MKSGLSDLALWELAMKRAAIYLRVSTIDQHTSNQEAELRLAAERAGWEVVQAYKDYGISGAKGRNGRPAFGASTPRRRLARRYFKCWVFLPNLNAASSKNESALAFCGPSVRANASAVPR
jgi:hypothetical protein